MGIGQVPSAAPVSAPALPTAGDAAERPIGAALTLGTGVTHAGTASSATADVGVAWAVRVAVGTRRWVAVEAAYVGSFRSVAADGDATDAGLLQNGFEGLVRGNLGMLAVQPYAVVGAGVSRVEVVNAADTMLTTTDDVITLPIGVGLSFYVGRGAPFASTIDLRFIYQGVFDEDLDGPAADLDQWMMTIQAGWEL